MINSKYLKMNVKSESEIWENEKKCQWCVFLFSINDGKSIELNFKSSQIFQISTDQNIFL